MSNSKTEFQSFPSKIDWWVALLLLFAPGIHLPLAIWVMSKGLPLFGVGLIVWGLIILVVILAMSFPCKYDVSEEHLVIRSGMFSDKIRLSKIEQIEPKRSWGASTALSVDRLELKLNDDSIRLISPKDKAGFTTAVQRAN